MTKGDNQFVQVFDIRGTCQPDSLKKSLIEMSLSVELSGRTTKGLYHVVINPKPGEARMMTREQWFRAAEIIEQQRGFVGQKRVMVMHEKKGRLHMHVAWERYSHDTGKIICNKHSNRELKHCRRAMEIEFGHQLTPEANAERPALRLLLADWWQHQPTGKGFVAAAAKAGYTIAKQSGRRDLIIVDSKGHSEELVKNIYGARARQVRDRLKGLTLPDKVQVIDAIRERQRSRRKRKTRDQIANDLKQHLNRDMQKSKERGR
ncbi:relaxase/mobilization nuclease domain-containing protein [Niastella vici]|uniref:relaxase/mobilization nuclease domain-containing protein n=1 Tax=Niastella vici TaxID=1703345 RepID=UPI001FEA80A1